MDYIIEENMIYIKDDNNNIIAQIEFEKISEDTYNIYHTFVDESLRGKGVASDLVKKAVEEIEKRGFKVQATCTYASAWLERHKNV